MGRINTVISLLFLANFPLKSQDLIPLPTSGAVKKMDLSVGKSEMSLKMSDGSDWKMMCSVPKIVDGETKDLVLALHWGVRANEYDEFMNCLMIPSIDLEKYIVIAPISDRQFWWKNPKEKQLLRLIQLAKKHLPIDKVIVTGYSDGGTGSIYFASNHPEKVDATIAVAGYYDPIEKFEKPTYIIHGKKDQLFNFEESKKNLKEALTANDQLKFIAADDLSHYEGCNYVELLQDAFSWIESRIH